MMKGLFKSGGKWLLVPLLALVLALSGCSDGDDGAPGAPGQPGAPGLPATELGVGVGLLNAEITGISISSNSVRPSVTVRLTDASGKPVVNYADDFEFTIAKLIPGINGNPDIWQSYINRSRLQPGGVNVLRAAGERATVINNGDGTYSYTFQTDLADVVNWLYYGNTGAPPNPGTGQSGVITSPAGAAVLASLNLTYDPNAVTRIAVSSRASGTVSRFNATVDFIPAQLPALLDTPARAAATNESCGACHGDPVYFPNFHASGSRFDINLCTQCHNPNTYDSRGSTDTVWATLDLGWMVHKIHSAEPGYTADGRDYSNLTYPQNLAGVGGVANCRACHNNQHPLVTQPAGRSTADAERWMTEVAVESCGACHTNIVNGLYDHATGNAPGVGQRDNTSCAGCHTTAATNNLNVEVAHRTNYSTPNNPNVPAGVPILTYEIASVTVDGSNQPIVRFRILADGAPLNLNPLPAGYAVAGTNPNFKIIWTSPMPEPTQPLDGPAIAAPSDWNNLFGTARTYFNNTVSTGESAFDQPNTVGLAAIAAGLPAPDALGFYTTTLSSPFPANAVMRAIALEGTMTTPGGTLSGETAMAGVGLTDTPRRKVVDINKCNLCHERIRFHGGGGRDNNPDHCVACHNPEMTSSNIMINPATGLSYETSNNLKDMLHALHAGTPVGGDGVRETPYIFIRGNAAGGGGGQGIHDFSHVGYPNRLSDCTTCHIGNSYLPPAPANALWSVYEASTAALVANFTPEDSLRLPPVTSACIGCHDSVAAQNHYNANLAVDRDGNYSETCVTCHGAGRSADVRTMHGIQ